MATRVGKQFAEENNMPFLETSAKNSSNIDQLFSQLARTLRDLHANKLYSDVIEGTSGKFKTISLDQLATEKGKKASCCRF